MAPEGRVFFKFPLNGTCSIALQDLAQHYDIPHLDMHLLLKVIWNRVEPGGRLGAQHFPDVSNSCRLTYLKERWMVDLHHVHTSYHVS